MLTIPRCPLITRILTESKTYPLWDVTLFSKCLLTGLTLPTMQPGKLTGLTFLGRAGLAIPLSMSRLRKLPHCLRLRKQRMCGHMPDNFLHKFAKNKPLFYGTLGLGAVGAIWYYRRQQAANAASSSTTGQLLALQGSKLIPPVMWARLILRRATFTALLRISKP